MAHEFDTTTAGANTTSYVTVSDADDYWADRVHANAAWDAGSDTLKQNALNWAARLLDEWVDWTGYRTLEGQRLRWPRYDVLDRDGWVLGSDSIPRFLQDAASELAGYLMTTDSTAQPDTLGFSKLKVGDLELEVDKLDRDKYGSLPDSVISMVEFYGAVRKRGGGGVVKLSRA